LDFFFFMYDIQHCFVCRPSDSTVAEDAGIEPRAVATAALAVRRSNRAPNGQERDVISPDSKYFLVFYEKSSFEITKSVR
jgi:hypothetical protein